jgi:hypothetical protein
VAGKKGRPGKRKGEVQWRLCPRCKGAGPKHPSGGCKPCANRCRVPVAVKDAPAGSYCWQVYGVEKGYDPPPVLLMSAPEGNDPDGTEAAAYEEAAALKREGAVRVSVKRALWEY